MKPNHQSIHLISQDIWQQPELKHRMDRLIWQAAREEDMVFDQEPVENRRAVEPARLHADLERLLAGEPLKFPETRRALEELRSELQEIGFRPVNECRVVRDEGLGVAGIFDAAGVIDGEPVILELKCVRFIPQVVRASEASQLLLYSLAKYGRSDAPLLLALYIQPFPPFRLGIRPVLNPAELEPLVRQLAA